jgi:HK97 family phage portal protein
MAWPFSRKSAPPVETKATEDTTTWWPFTDWFQPNSSGVALTPDLLMKCAPANAGVMLISDSTAMLPCSLLEEIEDDGKAPAKDHPAYELVHGFANDWASAGHVRRAVTIDAIIRGDGFGFVSKVGGKPSEIIHLPYGTVSIEWLPTGQPLYSINGEQFGADQILHLAQPNWNGATAQRGLGLLHTGADAIGLAILLERSAARLFKNNARPGGLISFVGQLTPAAATRAATSWKSAHGGDNSGGTAVLDNSASYTPIAFTSVDSQHAEMRQFAIAEISRLTRVPVTMLGDLSKGTYANVEQQNLQFLQLCLMPWLRSWQDAYSRTLLTKDERSKYCFDFAIDELLRADTAARATAISQFRAAGVMTSNDARRQINLPPLPDGDKLENPFTTSPGKVPANDNIQPPKENAA